MLVRRIVTVGLLLFVGASIIWLIVQGSGGAPDTGTGEAEGPPARAYQVVATYFHRTKRCKTCNSIERLGMEALRTGLPEAWDSGELVWRTLNLDDAENERFVADFDLALSMIVLEKLEEGRRVKWQRLDEVWDLVDDSAAFGSYVREEARALLAKGS